MSLSLLTITCSSGDGQCHSLTVNPLSARILSMSLILFFPSSTLGHECIKLSTYRSLSMIFDASGVNGLFSSVILSITKLAMSGDDFICKGNTK